jgi:hypothetical protein
LLKKSKQDENKEKAMGISSARKIRGTLGFLLCSG